MFDSALSTLSTRPERTLLGVRPTLKEVGNSSFRLFSFLVESKKESFEIRREMPQLYFSNIGTCWDRGIEPKDFCSSFILQFGKLSKIFFSFQNRLEPDIAYGFLVL